MTSLNNKFLSLTLFILLLFLSTTSAAVEVYYFKFTTPQNATLSIPQTNYPINPWKPQNPLSNDTNTTLLQPIHVLERVVLSFVEKSGVVPYQPDPSLNRIFSSCVAIGTERCLIFTNRSGKLVPPLEYHETYDNSSERNAHRALHEGFVNIMASNGAFATVPCPSNITLDNGTVVPSPFSVCTEFIAAIVYANEYQVANIGTAAGAGSNNNANQDINNGADPTNIYYPSIYADAPHVLVGLLQNFTARYADTSLFANNNNKNNITFSNTMASPNRVPVPANISILLSQLGVVAIEQGFYTFLSVQKSTFPVMVVMVAAAAVVVVAAFIGSYICIRKKWAADEKRKNNDRARFIRDDDAYSMPEQEAYEDDGYAPYSSPYARSRHQSRHEGAINAYISPDNDHNVNQNNVGSKNSHLRGVGFDDDQKHNPQLRPNESHPLRRSKMQIDPSNADPLHDDAEEEGQQEADVAVSAISPNESHTYVSDTTFHNGSISSKNFGGNEYTESVSAESQAQFREVYQATESDLASSVQPRTISTLSERSEASNNAFAGSQNSAIHRSTQPFISMSVDGFKQ